MKINLLRTLDLLVCVLALTTQQLEAQFTFTTNSDNSLNVSGYTGVDGTVVIPSETNGLPITSIGTKAFYYLTNISDITIPDSILTIGLMAFQGCNGLTNVSIGNQVATIGNSAFQNCIRLSSITIPDDVTSVGSAAFAFCSALAEVSMGAGVTNLGDIAFSECYSLTSFTIPGNVISIGANEFTHDRSITNIILENGIVSIGNSAFSGCTNLTTFSLPDSVITIGTYEFTGDIGITNITIGSGLANLGAPAFAGCSNLLTITVSPLNTNLSSLAGVLFNKDQTILLQFPNGLKGSYAVPDGVTNIGDYAFTSSSGLNRVFLPKSISRIGNWSFSSCLGLYTFVATGNAPSIGVSPFLSDLLFPVYYLPGATGWTSSFGGHPTYLWNPQVQTGAPNFGVQTNQFGFSITGTSGLVIVVDATTNLVAPVWLPAGTNTISGLGSSYFHDSSWTNYNQRFYRLRPR